MSSHDRAYEPPRLTELGTLADLTAGGIALGGGDFLGMQSESPIGGDENDPFNLSA